MTITRHFWFSVLSLCALGCLFTGCPQPTPTQTKKQTQAQTTPTSRQVRQAPVKKPPVRRVEPLDAKEKIFLEQHGYDVAIFHKKKWTYFADLPRTLRTPLITLTRTAMKDYKWCSRPQPKHGCRLTRNECEGIVGVYRFTFDKKGMLTSLHTKHFGGCGIFQITNDKAEKTIFHDHLKTSRHARSLYKRAKQIHQCHLRRFNKRTYPKELANQRVRIRIGWKLRC